MSFLDNQKKIAALYVAAYNRAPDQEGLEYWTNFLQDADDEYAAYVSVAERFVAVDLFDEIYNTSEGNRLFVESVYQNMFGEAGDEEGIEYWTEALDNGASKGAFLVRFLDAARGYEADPENPLNEEALAHQAILENKIDVGLYYVETLGEATNVTTPGDVNDPAYQNSMNVIAGVTADEGTVASAKETIDRQVVEPVGDTFYLTETRDVLEGTENADTFVADIVQNQDGLQVNTLGSGDRLDGGDGTDTLVAEVTAGAYAGGAGNMDIQPKTTDIENIKLQAVATGPGKGYGEQDYGPMLVVPGVNPNKVAAPGSEVFVNGKDMLGVDYIGSERSNASLTIKDLTTKDNDGNARNTSDMTVGMKYTGNTNSQWDESDLTVLFDQDYLQTTIKAEAGWNYKILNQDSYDENSAQPVKDFPLTAIRFDLKLNGGAPVRESLTFTQEEMEGIYTQQQLVDALNSKLDARDDLSGLQFQLGAPFTDTNGRQSTSIDLVNTKPEQQTIVAGAVGIDEESAAGNIFWRNAEIEQTEEVQPVEINVELEKVGRAGDGGELVIGSMNKGADTNTWNATDVNTVAAGTVSGVEVFNVDVFGDKDKSSSLSGMRSTNNNLRKVNVSSADNGDADLTIGNTNTFGTLGTLFANTNALKDVQTFNAFNFNGDLTLHAALTDEVTAKYMDLRDDQADPTDDNFAFTYTGGKGDDTINLVIDSSNLAKAGTTTREDFVLTIDGGKGDDTIIASIQDFFGGLAAAGNWYNNSKINANLNVLGGDGDDTVYLNGTGDWKVNLGAGDDVVYAGNSGNPVLGTSTTAYTDQKTVWVFNTEASAAQRNLDDLASNLIDTYVGIYKSTISVSFKQGNGTFVSKIVEVPTDATFAVTDLHINQAIKEAINTDPVLSNLLEATDGPAGALVVNSLIDGARSSSLSDLNVSWNPPASGTLNQADLNAFNADTTGPSYATVALLEAAIASNITAASNFGVDYASGKYATDGTNEYIGTDSSYQADNIIIGGAGDDVIVLGTGAGSNDTVKYEGFDNGTDSIVNFTTGAGPGDFIAKNDPYSGSLTLLDTDFIDLTSYKAKFVDFGAYTTVAGVKTGWVGATTANADFGKGTSTASNLALDDIFLRVNQADDVYEVEVWKVKVANTNVDAMTNVATDANIEKLGTVGTLDFGLTPAAGFFDVNNFII